MVTASPMPNGWATSSRGGKHGAEGGAHGVFHAAADIGGLVDHRRNTVTRPCQQTDARRAHRQLCRPGGQPARGQPVAVIGNADRRGVALDRHDLDRDQVRLADEIGDEGIGRRFIQLARGALLRDAGIAHHHDLVRHRQRLFLIMGHIDHGQAKVLLDLADLLAHLPAQLGVQVRQRFVEQQHLRFQHQRARHRDALLLAARQFATAGGRHSPSGPPAPARPCARSARLGLVEAGKLQPIADIFQHRHMRKQRVGLKHHRHVAVGRGQRGHVLVADQDLARAWPFPAPRSSAGSWSCRSPTAPAGSPACPPRPPGRCCRRPPHRGHKPW